MINNKGGHGSGPGEPMDPKTMSRERHSRRKGGRGSTPEPKFGDDEELSGKLTPPTNVDDRPIAEILAEKGIVPTTTPVFASPEVPNVEQVLKEISAKENISKSVELLEKFKKDFDLSDDIASLLEKVLLNKSDEELSKFESNIQLVLRTLKDYTRRFSLTEFDQHNFAQHMFTHYFVDKKYSESSMQTFMAMLLSDLRLYEEVKKMADTNAGAEIKTETAVETAVEELPLPQENVQLSLTSPDEILEKAEPQTHVPAEKTAEVQIESMPEIQVPSVEKATPVSTEKIQVHTTEVQTFEQSAIPEKLQREWLSYKNQKENLEQDIQTLESRNREINNWTDSAPENWHNNDSKLKEYGDICREYTLNIQKLRELDGKLARIKVLYEHSDSRVKVLQSSLALGLPLTALAEKYESEVEERLEDRQRVKLVFENKQIHTVDIDVSEGKMFANVSFTEPILGKDLEDYVQAQRSFLKNSKSISKEDNYEIDKVFRLDYLSQHLDFNSLDDGESENTLGRRLDQKYFEIHKYIADTYQILLPTRKAGVPLYFQGNQARIPLEYLKGLYVYNRDNNLSLKNKVDLVGLSEPDSLMWIEATLYSRVMNDATISLGQLEKIKTRLNAILLTHPQLKKNWLSLQSKEDVIKDYPYLKYAGGWFKDLEIEEIRERMKNVPMEQGVFEEAELATHLPEEKSEEATVEAELVEELAAPVKVFIEKLENALDKIEISETFSEADKQEHIVLLNDYVSGLMKYVTNEQEALQILIEKRNEHKLTGQESDEERDIINRWYQFFDDLITLANDAV